MVEFKQGDVLKSNAEAVVNPVNCVGVMGRGLALQFEAAYPDNFNAYATACKRREVQPGRMFVFKRPQPGQPKFIINFPTKRHWRDGSRMADTEAGLAALVGEIRERRIRSIAIPALGSGLGGLRWEDVRPRMEQALGVVENVSVLIFEPLKTV